MKGLLLELLSRAGQTRGGRRGERLRAEQLKHHGPIHGQGQGQFNDSDTVKRGPADATFEFVLMKSFSWLSSSQGTTDSKEMRQSAW